MTRALARTGLGLAIATVLVPAGLAVWAVTRGLERLDDALASW